jgi:hypothetical protein
MKRFAWSWFFVVALGLALPGCFFKSKGPSSSSSPHATSSPPKNRGQARKEEVHERNAERKADKDAAKEDKKKDK